MTTQRLDPFDPNLMEKLGFDCTSSPRFGEACGHPGCLSHISHPCEGCGRTGGNGVTWRELMENRKKLAALTPEEMQAFIKQEEADNPGVKVSVICGVVHMWGTSIHVSGNKN